jgi:hypothetical protein
MIYSIHSDAGYLNEANARSHAGEHHFLSENQPFPPNNGAILTISEIIKAVISSATEAELGALYINARKRVEIHNIHRNWDIVNLLRLYKPTTVRLRVSSTVVYNLSAPKPWTCIFTGSMTEASTITNSVSSGDLVTPI